MRGVRLPRGLRRWLLGILFIVLGVLLFPAAGLITPLIPLCPVVGWILFAAALFLALCCIWKGMKELGVKL